MQPHQHAPTFIVGTGRCGSTMLSNILRRHPDILSLSEFFSLVTDLGGRIAQCFPERPISAQEFVQIVAGRLPKSSLMHLHGVAMDEVLYRPGPGTRFTPQTGVPAILETTLPHLTAGHEELLDEVCAYLAGGGPALAGEHYTRLFSWLRERFGKLLWVERSGGSLRIVRRLAQTFPGARFVHLVRDGRNCALSMSRHYGFRMALIAMQLTEILGVDPFESPDRTWAGDVPEELWPFLPESFDGAAFREYETPVPLCGHYWSGEIMAGLRELAAIPAERVLTLRYEDFLSAPQAAIDRLVSFVCDGRPTGPGHEPWVRSMADTVRASRSAWHDLPVRERAELAESCRPGFAALGWSESC